MWYLADGEEWAVLAVPGSLVNISHTYHVLGKAALPTDMAINSLAFNLRTNSLLYTDSTCCKSFHFLETKSICNKYLV